jgi:HD-GYP domain-containing protein (c-di-GMP phosphodiesterase class II)
LEPSPVEACSSLVESLFAAIEQGSGYTCVLLDAQPLNASEQDFCVTVAPHRKATLRILGSPGGRQAVGQSTVRALEQIFQRYLEQQSNMDTLRRLYELSTTLHQTIHLNDLLERILTFARQLVRAGSATLVMLDSVHSELKMLQQSGQERPILTSTRVEPGDDLQAWLRQEGQLRRTPGGASTPCVLGMPLRSQQRVVGSLTLIGGLETEFSDSEVQALTILAGHAANAIHNAQLFGQVERQLSELKALQQLSESLNRTVSMEQVLDELLEETLSQLQAENASVMLLEPDGQTLTIKMARGLPEEVVAQTRVKLGERISGKVAAEKKPIVYYQFDEADESGSALSVPLLKDDQVLGVLNVRQKKNGGDFSAEELSLASRFANVAALSISKAGLHSELRMLFVHSIRALANAIDARDPYTSGHSERVTRFSVLIAERMGFQGERLEELRYASLLHDIGKIRIRDAILHKPGKLDDEEFEEMKRHPEYGVEIMQPVRAFQGILPYMLHHHERFDGRGYPAGLSGNQIPLQARIMCVADCFDAMTSDRPYRAGMPVEAAVAELRKWRGSQFDPEATDLFLALIQEGKVGDIVEPRTQTA